MKKNLRIRYALIVVIIIVGAILGYCSRSATAPEETPEFEIEAVPIEAPAEYVYYFPIIYKAPPGLFIGFGDDVGTKNDISVLPDAPFFDWWLGYYKARWDDPNYYRMIWATNTSVKADDGIRYTIEDMAAYDYAHGMNRKWLIFNEPDMVGQAGDIFKTKPEYAAQLFSDIHDMITTHDPTATFYVGGLVYLSASESRAWWLRFIAELDRLNARDKVDGVHVHLYPGVSMAQHWQGFVYCGFCIDEIKASADNWYNEMHVPYFGDKPIIVTETGFLSRCDQSRQREVWDNFYKPIMNWLYNQREYDGVFIFVTNTRSYNGDAFSCSWLIDDNGNLTYLGQQYKAFIEAR